MKDASISGIGIPGYRLVRAIGSSGVATVYQATQRSLERQVAVKVMDLPDEESIARFAQLLRTNARLVHPDIVDVTQIGRTADGRLFHAMPFLLSVALARHNFARKPLKVAALLRVVLGALEHAHRRGIVHGGIKPTNVLLDRHEHPFLADFGMARCAADMGLPQSGTASYLSPEQARGQPPGQRSDLYSVGILAFELLTGAPPFAGSDPVATAIAHVEQPVPKLPQSTAAWQPWLDKALAKEPEQRFQSAQEMADALQPIDGRTAGSSPAREPFASRAPVVLAAAGLLVVLIAVTSWTAWRQRMDSQTPPVVVAPASATTATPAGTGSLAIPPSPAGDADALAMRDRVDLLTAQADRLRAGGHLFSPPGNSAVEHYLTALILDPGNPVATRGIDAMLETLQRRLDAAWDRGRNQDVLDLLQKCDLLATHAGPDARRGWQASRDKLARQVGSAVAAATRNRDKARVAGLRTLAETLPARYPAGTEVKAPGQVVVAPESGAVVRDANGPLLVYMAAAPGGSAFAIGRVEVTRSDYAAFVDATKRPASRCLEAYNPFSRMRRLSWRSPGFAQGGTDPVVCVSWNDAVAYAAWLSSRTGEQYRLPTNAEWLRAAQGVPKGNPCQLGNVDDASRASMMDNDRLACSDGAAATAPVGRYAPSGAGVYDMYGNVSEWLAGGTTGTRTFRGLSWRDGSQHTPLSRKGTAADDTGYTNVGFRLVREIDATHPAPPPVPAG